MCGDSGVGRAPYPAEEQRGLGAGEVAAKEQLECSPGRAAGAFSSWVKTLIFIPAQQPHSGGRCESALPVTSPLRMVPSRDKGTDHEYLLSTDSSR